ncbi:hypothetical protein BGZ76_000350 [Entomortierella beljakovae]|nr:hypothetical protein BGZ76_000350 [Entomortierella beljakovae]
MTTLLTVRDTPVASCANIPSPPMSPYLDTDTGTFQPPDQEKDVIFSSRFQDLSLERKFHTGSSVLMRQASSAPSSISPLESKLSSGNTPGFTFTSNLQSPTYMQGGETRDSYQVFVDTIEQDYWKTVSTIHTTYFFDGIGRGGGFLAIPHIASHGNAKTNSICRLLEAWLTEKLVEPTISDSIPVLEDNIESSVRSIEQHLGQDPKVWSGISKAFIHIRCGHVFMLNTCCDDDTIVHLGAYEFYQEYPLFVDVEIKMYCDTHSMPKDQATEVLIAFKNVTGDNNETKNEVEPFVHRTMIKRRQSQDEV